MRRLRQAHIASSTLGLREAVDALLRPLGTEDAERAIERLARVPSAVVFASARGALAAAAAVLAPSGRVAVPAYTCVAVPYAMQRAGAELVYADVDGRGLVPPQGWPASDLVLVQDTYGFVSELPAGRPVVCDSTHRADLVLQGGRGAVRVTSFEHSKTLSAGQGGLAVTDDPDLARRLRGWRDAQDPVRRPRTHGLVTILSLLLGRLEYRGLALAGLPLELVLHLLAPARMGTEARESEYSQVALGAPTGTSARLMTTQLAKLGQVVEHRRDIVGLYDKEAGVSRAAEPLVRYPMLAEVPEAFERRLASSGWNVRGRWFATPIHPIPARDAPFGYEPGSAPGAERLAAAVVNLPTHPRVRKEEALELISLALAAGARPIA